MGSRGIYSYQTLLLVKGMAIWRIWEVVVVGGGGGPMIIRHLRWSALVRNRGYLYVKCLFKKN